MTRCISEKVVFALVCLACLGTAVSAQVESKRSEGKQIVRQVDHIVIRLDTTADAEALWSLFSEKLKLPIAWPPGDYGDFFSGGGSGRKCKPAVTSLSSRLPDFSLTP